MKSFIFGYTLQKYVSGLEVGSNFVRSSIVGSEDPSIGDMEYIFVGLPKKKIFY